MADPSAEKQQTPADFGKGRAGNARRWISEIDLAEKSQAKWLDRCKDIIKRYDADAKLASATVDDTAISRFALLWSNMETLEPAVFNRAPAAVVGRRWKDPDQIGRVASEILERALNFCLDTTDFEGAFKEIAKDFLLLARGVPWVRYVPTMKTVTPERGEIGDNGGPPLDAEGAEPVVQQGSDGQVAGGDEPYDVVDWEETICDHVSYNEFLHNVARKWADVTWVGRKVFMTRGELRTRFKGTGPDGHPLADTIPLDHKPDDTTEAQAEQFAKATIYEIWDKPTRYVCWISKGLPETTLDERDDPLGLKDFFPCPRPAIGTRSPDTVLPTADYNYYAGQDRQINKLTQRIALLMEALQLKGFYAAGSEMKDALANLFAQGTGTMVPVDSWAAMKDGMAGLVVWLPVGVVAAALKSAIEARQQLIQDVYQITGISDIMRGDVDPDETATATRKKSTWGSSRVRNKQQELARVASETLQIMGQIIASKFQPETLAKMTNVKLLASDQARQMLLQHLQVLLQPPPAPPPQPGAPPQPPPQPQPPSAQTLSQVLKAVGVEMNQPSLQDIQQLLQSPTWDDVMGLLRDETLRTFRIDVEADSTIAVEDEEDKASAIEFVETIGKLVGNLMPLIQVAPQLLPVATQTILFLVRRYRVGREMEEVIENAFQQLQGAAQGAQGQQQPQKPPGPDPQVEQMKGQAAVQTAQARVMDAQTNQQRAQTDRFEAQAGAQLEQHRLGLEQQQQNLDRQLEVHMQGQDISAELRQATMKAWERQAAHQSVTPFVHQPIGQPPPPRGNGGTP